MPDSEGFTAGGYEQHRALHEPAIRERVEAEFANMLENASWFQRRKIRKQIEGEINRQCDELVPPDSLY